MAAERNITEADEFFLGEDKVLELTIFGEDQVTPLDVSGLPLRWSLRKTDKAPDPPILLKSITGGVPNGIEVVGVHNVDPSVNTQRVRVIFASADTDPVVTAALVTNPYKLKAGTEYRHSLKRHDPGNEGVLTYGSCTFLQATER